MEESGCEGGDKFAKFIHRSLTSDDLSLLGVKRELTFYDLKCEFYR